MEEQSPARRRLRFGEGENDVSTQARGLKDGFCPARDEIQAMVDRETAAWDEQPYEGL